MAYLRLFLLFLKFWVADNPEFWIVEFARAIDTLGLNLSMLDLEIDLLRALLKGEVRKADILRAEFLSGEVLLGLDR